jgi:hypothetical protein
VRLALYVCLKNICDGAGGQDQSNGTPLKPPLFWLDNIFKCSKKNISDGVGSQNESIDTCLYTPLFFGWTISLRALKQYRRYEKGKGELIKEIREYEKDNSLIYYIDTKAKMSSKNLKTIPVKELCGRCLSV